MGRLEPRDTEALEDVLRATGHRVSGARRLVLMALFAAGRPVTAEDIASGLQGRLPPSELSSIYRNLELLEQQGLAYHVHLGHGPRHLLVGADEHCYVVCEVCDRVDAVASSDLDDARSAIADGIGYQATFTHFAIVGVCPDAGRRPRPSLRRSSSPGVSAAWRSHSMCACPATAPRMAAVRRRPIGPVAMNATPNSVAATSTIVGPDCTSS
jgi:Fe2+ or Zn2+ uptake regulation protein